MHNPDFSKIAAKVNGFFYTYYSFCFFNSTDPFKYIAGKTCRQGAGHSRESFRATGV